MGTEAVVQQYALAEQKLQFTRAPRERKSLGLSHDVLRVLKGSPALPREEYDALKEQISNSDKGKQILAFVLFNKGEAIEWGKTASLQVMRLLERSATLSLAALLCPALQQSACADMGHQPQCGALFGA
eukprot:2111665-Amphidinium_carterae.1